jgi:hypothetical protein
MQTTPEHAPSSPPADPELEATLQSGLRKAAGQILSMLGSLNPGALEAQLEEDVTKYTRLVNALAKLSEAQLKREVHKLRLLERQARIAGADGAGQRGGLTPEALETIRKELDLL